MDFAFFMLFILMLLVAVFAVVVKLWFNNQRYEREQNQRSLEASVHS